MGEDSRGKPALNGRKDLVHFIAKVLKLTIYKAPDHKGQGLFHAIFRNDYIAVFIEVAYELRLGGPRMKLLIQKRQMENRNSGNILIIE